MKIEVKDLNCTVEDHNLYPIRQKDGSIKFEEAPF